MEFKQSSIEEIAESERDMVLRAKERFGDYYTHARSCAVYFSLCVEEISPDGLMFGRLFSLARKHEFLSLLSTVRLHKVQAMMDLRQTFEAGTFAAFAIANREYEHFVELDKLGVLNPSSALGTKAYRWVSSNYPDQSKLIKQAKDQINSATAHANVAAAESIFHLTDIGDRAHTPFFDAEDEYLIKADLWLIASAALTLLDRLRKVNSSHKILTFRTDFSEAWDHFASRSDHLRAQAMNHERYRAVIDEFGEL